MTISGKADEPFTVRFIDDGSKALLELLNGGGHTLKHIEILTVFLKDEETSGGGPSRAHIKFEAIEHLQAKESVVLSHRTWVDGKPVAIHQDQLERLKARAGEVKPYVLDISWEDTEGKTRFQRIPVGY